MIWLAGLSVLAIVGACVAILIAIDLRGEIGYLKERIRTLHKHIDDDDALRISEDIAELRRELVRLLEKEANHADYDC